MAFFRCNSNNDVLKKFDLVFAQKQTVEDANIAEGQANAPATAEAQGTNCN